MSGRIDPIQAAKLLKRGELLLYPTEAVWGLGCDPFNPAAIARLLALKQRAQAKGLILIASRVRQLDGLIELAALAPERRASVLQSWPGPHTWIMPCTATAPASLRGEHDSLAVRVSAHPDVIALCDAFDGALVSTSANLSGDAPVTRFEALDPHMLSGVAGVLQGETGGLARPTPIRVAASGELLRD